MASAGRCTNHLHFAPGASIPMGQGGYVPSPIFMKGRTSIVMSPHNILGLFYPVTATTVVCCILVQILCVVSQKKSLAFEGLRPPDPLPGLRPWTLLGDFCPQTPSLLLCPPNNPVRSTPLWVCLSIRSLNTCAKLYILI